MCVSRKSYRLWFTATGQLHRHSRQVGNIPVGQEGGAGILGKHILFVDGSLVAPEARTAEEEEAEKEKGGAGRTNHVHFHPKIHFHWQLDLEDHGKSAHLLRCLRVVCLVILGQEPSISKIH